MKNHRLFSFFCLSVCCFLFSGLYGDDPSDLEEEYQTHCNLSTDINEHLPVLCKYSSECTTVTEIGVKPMNSTWGVLQGLSENTWPEKSYVGIDSGYPPLEKLQEAQAFAQEQDILFSFSAANEMEIEFEPADLLFIDSLHTYCHLTYELETFSPKVRKYICLHDTSEPFGLQDDPLYLGDYSEYPASYDRTKSGLWPAVEDFLKSHPEWSLEERLTNNHGLTILKRKKEAPNSDSIH